MTKQNNQPESIQSIYQEKIASLSRQLSIESSLSTRFTWLRSLTFLVFVASIYAYFQMDFGRFFGLVPLVLFFLFLRFVGHSAKVKQRVKLLQQLVQVNQSEINYLNHQLDGLPDGQEYQDSGHFYAYDLDVFGHHSLFQHINRTALREGADVLAKWLKNPLFDVAAIQARQAAILELKDALDFRQKYQAIGELDHLPKKKLGKQISLNSKLVQGKYFYFIFILPVITVSLFVLSFFNIAPSGYAYLMVVIQLLLTYLFNMTLKTTDIGLGEFAKQISPYIRLIQTIDNQEFRSAFLQKNKHQLLDPSHHALLAFQQLRKLLNSFEQRLSPVYILVGNGVFLIDFYLLKKVDRWFVQYGDRLESWMDALAEINALSSLANFYANHPHFILPGFSSDVLLSAQGLGHPLIPMEKNVTNDFEILDLHEMYIVTGANMAGKSTFLRTVGINILLASVGAPVCADRFEFQPIHLFTSMRTTDDLSEDVSYFHAELLRLKKLVETVEAHPNEKYIIILDEILKGTNSKDKLMGSVLFLEKLLKYPISGLIATHDLELGKLADKHPQNFKNICFEIEIANDDVTYDYKLRPGITQNFNATFLLGKMGLR